MRVICMLIMLSVAFRSFALFEVVRIILCVRILVHALACMQFHKLSIFFTAAGLRG